MTALDGVGAGIRYLPVAHEGRSQVAPEEAERIARGYLDVRCRSVEQMRLVNALCRFVEQAE